MHILVWIIAATIADSLVGLLGIFSLWIKDDLIKKAGLYLMSFSAGALLGGAFFHFLPEALEASSAMKVFAFVVLGFVVFQILESYLHWHLCKECGIHPYSYLMPIGDALHNVIDGFVIAASFLVSVPFGIITTAVIILHEVPQEIGIFGAMVHGGQKKKTAIIYTFVSQATCVLGGIGGYFLSQASAEFSSFLIPFAAGGFLYIVAADLVPEMHKAGNDQKLKNFAVYAAGLLFMIAAKFYFEGG